MKRKQVLAISPLGSTLVVENETPQPDGAAPLVETYVMKRFATAQWTPDEEQGALGDFDRLIDFEPPVRHLVRHHSVVIQRGHVNLVISYCARGPLQRFISDCRASRLAGVAGASSAHQSAVAPGDCRSWFVMVATSVLDLHSHGMIHGNCNMGNLLCSDATMVSSEDNAPAVVLGPSHPPRHVAARVAQAVKESKTPAMMDTCFAPEVQRGSIHGNESDVYLLGVLLCDLVLLAAMGSPFAPDELHAISPTAKAAAVGDSSFRRYALSLLHEDPRQRPGMNELLAAIPMLDWTAAIVGAGQPSRSAGASANRRSSSTGRDASQQPTSPLRNASPARPPVAHELFPASSPRGVGPASPEASLHPIPNASRRTMSADSPRHGHQALATSAYDGEAAELPVVPMGSQPTTPIFARARPRGTAARGAVGAPGVTDMDEWQRRTADNLMQIEQAMAAVPKHTAHAAVHSRHGAPSSAPNNHGLIPESSYPAAESVHPAIHRAMAPPPPPAPASSGAGGSQQGNGGFRSASSGAGSRGHPASSRGGGGGGGAPLQQPPAVAGPLNHRVLRTMTKTERMKALDEHGKLLSAKAAYYENERERKAMLTAAQKKEDDERLRQHRQHIQQIMSEKRRGVAEQARRGAAAAAGPVVEIFVHTPTRAGTRQWSKDDSLEHVVAPAAAATSVEIRQRLPTATAAAAAQSIPEGLFFVPLEKRSVRRSAFAQTLHAPAERPDEVDSPLQRLGTDAEDAASGGTDLSPRLDMEHAHVPAHRDEPFEEDAGCVASLAALPPQEHVRRSNSRRSGTASAARNSTRTSELFPSSSDDESNMALDVQATTLKLTLVAGEASSRKVVASANHGVAHPTAAALLTAVSSPSPDPMSASKLPIPSDVAAVAGAGGGAGAHGGRNLARREFHDDPVRGILPMPPAEGPAIAPVAPVAAAAVDTSASSIDVDGPRPATSSAASTHTGAARRAKNDKFADSELVAVVEWNVDLIRRQLTRYMDSDVLDDAIAMCRQFARGATEARTNPRANHVLMSRLSDVIGEDVMPDCAPLLFQFIALDATLATAEQLRAVESQGRY